RFCTNCGAPVGPRPQPAGTPPDATVQRPVVPPDASVGSRFPLYASPPPPPPPPTAQFPATPPPVPAPPVAGPPVAGPPMAGPPVGGAPLVASDGRRQRPQRRLNRRADLTWIALLVVAMVAAAATGIWLATRDSGSGVAGNDPESSTSSTPDSSTTGPTDPTDEPDDGATDGDDIDLAPHTQVDAPRPARPGVDLAGKPVTYPASNMLDDDATTAYRMPGDATGVVIRFELPQASTIKQVGLINGYAKTDVRDDRTVEWYTRNRRVLTVEWRFDDGTKVVQELTETPTLQTMPVDPIKTQVVELRILEVTKPPSGPLAKNVTSISDILLLGS
ncbi:NADase-type glycan-binding domain-containing protein, partial [Nocardia salmonicida]|uniref:NADase-type glycan-binding domain-containing protein n=1 Tax=Nocardia salmonicida TaxID=53431 RepID=UPI00348AD63B